VAPALRRQFENAAHRTPFHLLRGLGRLRSALERPAPQARPPERLALYVSRSLGACRGEYERIVVQGERAVDDLLHDHYDADVALAPGSPEAVYKRALLEAVLGRWREVSTRAGVPVLVLVIPSPIDVCDAFAIKVDRGAEYPEYDPARLSREAAEAARRQGLAVVDLFAPFRAAGADGLYYHYENDHWNPSGQDFAARLAAERILAEGWLAPGR
jgi:hypothetical protein